MEGLLSDVETWLTAPRLAALGRSVIIVIVGFGLTRLVRSWLRRAAVSPQQALLIRRGVVTGVLVLTVAGVLRELGFSLGTLLGAAGLFSLAIGFAAQTSVSNLLSGLFLVGEQPFVVGDLISVEDSIGEVLSIDVMAVRIRTFDNLVVRIPNETMLKAKVTNYTSFPIRRHTLMVGVAYKESISHVREVLEQLAKDHPLVLVEPPPVVVARGFLDSSIHIQFSVWCRKESFMEVKHQMFESVKEVFDDAGIEIAFPHLSLYAGSATAPLPVRLEGDATTIIEPARPR